MATYLLTPTPQQQIFSLDATTGLYTPASGAKVYTYVAGSTSTPISTYADNIGTLNSNPIVADAQGRFTAYLLAGTFYKYVITTSTGSPILTQDYIGNVASSSMSPSYKAKTGTYTAVANDFVSCTSGSFTVTLPSAAANANAAIWVVNNGTGTITVGRTGSDTVGLATTQTLNPGSTVTAQGDEMTFISDGISNWNIT